MVVSEDPLVRGGLAALLSDERGLDVVAQGAAEAVLGEDAHVAVWDAASGAGALEAIAGARRPGLGIVAVLGDPSLAAQALAAGAQGVVPRDVPPARLAAAVRAVAEGLVVFDRSSAEPLLRPLAVADAQAETLTAREQEVLQLVAEGLSNKLIAARLRISEHTAKFHVNSILGKLGAQTRAEAVAQAARLGLLLL